MKKSTFALIVTPLSLIAGSFTTLYFLEKSNYNSMMESNRRIVLNLENEYSKVNARRIELQLELEDAKIELERRNQN